MCVKKWKLVSFLLPCILLFLVIYLIPMIIVFVTSLFSWKAGGDFNFIGFDNYIDGFFKDPRLIQSIINTLIWILMQSTIHVGIGIILAVLLSREKKGWKILRTIYMIPNVVSLAALGIISVNVFNPKYGLINSFLSKITGTVFEKNWYFDKSSAFLTVTWPWLIYAGIIVIIILAGLMSIPKEIIEAAKIDGVSTIMIDLKIRLPIIRSVIGTCVILAATSMLREFELIYLTTNGGPGDTTINMPLYLYKTSMIDNNYGYANMMGVVLILTGIVSVYMINKIFKMNESV